METYLRTLDFKQGSAVGFRIDAVRLKNGMETSREYLVHPGAVAVLAFVKRDRILMVRQYRYPVGQPTWEIPAGKLDKGENPLECVKRELEEETGYKAGRIHKLISFWPTATFADEIIHIYVATHLTQGDARPDEDEFLSVKVWPIKRILSEIKNGTIKDSKTLIALLAHEQWKKSTGLGGGRKRRR